MEKIDVFIATILAAIVIAGLVLINEFSWMYEKRKLNEIKRLGISLIIKT
jgi:hypothetical protein